MKKLMIVGLCALASLLLFACGGNPNGNDAPTETTVPLTTAFRFNIDKNDPCYHVIKEIEDVDIQLLRYVYYVYYDIDGDGAEELLTGWGGCLERVYTIRNGVAVRQEQYFGDAESSIPPAVFRNGTIRSVITREGEGPYSYYYYRFVDGNLELQIELVDDIHYSKYHRIGNGEVWPGTSITKEEFDQLKQEMEGDGHIVELDWKPLAEYGR